MKTKKIDANVANVQVVSKSEARKAVLAKLSNEVSLNKFCKLMQELKNTDAKAYKDLLFAYKLSETFEFSFDWFKENTPQINGKFAYWKKVSDKTPANENKEYNRESSNGVLYTLVEYNVYKAEYKVFLQMFCNTVNEINRKKREAEKKQKTVIKKINEKRKQFEKLSPEEKIAYLNTCTDADKLALFA